MEELLIKTRDWFVINGPAYGIRLVASLAIFILGRWIAAGISRLLRRVAERRHLDPTVAAFVAHLTYIALLIFVIIAAIQNLGIPTASLVAVLGAAGLAVGLALQGSLSNFASGLLLIIFRPFRRGDVIEGAGTAGKVDEIQLFATVLITADNKRVIVPNSKLTGDNIVNCTALPTRRLDLKFGVGYGDDLTKVKAVLQGVLDEDARVLKEPKPLIAVLELADHSVNLAVRAWVKVEDYWDVHFDTHERVKCAFDREGITIPFPQREVRLIQAG